MNIAFWLEQQARANPLRPALFLGRDCVADYGQFWANACAVAGWLVDEGVAPGDRVALFMENTPDYLTVLYGVWIAGAAVVPINAKLHGREAAFILQDSGANHVFASPDQTKALIGVTVSARISQIPGVTFEKIRRHSPLTSICARAPDDLAWLFYTSGTTGKPKGVVITHRMLTNMSLCYAVDVDVVTDQNCTLYAAPMSHGAGLYNMVHTRVGARHVCPVSSGFDPDEIFELARYFEQVHLFAAPTMVKRMTDVARKMGLNGQGLRTVVYAGGPMYNADIIAAVDQFGAVFVQIYGQGECPMGITSLSRAEVADRTHPGWRARLRSVGRAQSAVQVAIGDEQGRPLPTGAQGEVMVRGDTVMPGYWQNEEASARTLLDGWLMTGDTGSMDGEGYVTLQDRSKDMIISGGSNIYPREVEEILLLDSTVIEVSVVGRPHPEWGEEVVAFVVGGCNPDRLDQLCLENIARFKRPKAYFEIEELPKNNYGKVLKTVLREQLAKM